MMKNNNSYTSFEEIGQQLRVLKIKKEIDVLCLKENVVQLKNNAMPSSIIWGLVKETGLRAVTDRRQWIVWGVDLALSLIRKIR